MAQALRRWAVTFMDRLWLHTFKWRLGHKYPVSPRANVSIRQGHRCGEFVQRHAVACSYGGLKVLLHDEVVTGATVRVEAQVP